MKAIILAAGTGTRLQSILKGNPKPLLELNGNSLLHYSLDALKKSGVNEVEIIVGFSGKIIKEAMGKNYLGLTITYIENPHYAATGSMHSLYLAIKDNPQDCLVLDGDIIYDPIAIKLLLDSSMGNAKVITDISGSGDEYIVEIDSENKITNSGKGIGGNYEFIGISKFSKDFMKELAEFYKKKVGVNQIKCNVEECVFNVSKSIPVQGLYIKNLIWSEIDKPEDLPRLLEKLTLLNHA